MHIKPSSSVSRRAFRIDLRDRFCILMFNSVCVTVCNDSGQR